MKLCRLILILAVLSFLGAGALLCFKTAWGLVIALIALLALAAKKRHQILSAFGTARWASVSDMERAGMLKAGSGLILGRVTVPRIGFLQSLRELFRKRIPAAIACENFVFSMRKFQPKKPDPAMVRLNKAVHIAVFAPTGAGKGVSFVIPHLLTCPDSCVVVDFKGENALITAEHRAKMFGHKIVILDPFDAVTRNGKNPKKLDRPSDNFNPLDQIHADSPLALDDCNNLAKALVVSTGEEREPHWNESAERWISGMAAVVTQFGETGNRSLQTVRTLLANPLKTSAVIKMMCESQACGGMLSRKGFELTKYVEKELGSVMTTTNRFMYFLDTLPIAANTTASSFDPADLCKGKMTVYLVLPPEHMRAQAGLLRMWVSFMLLAVVRGGLQETNRVHFVLDEAASLGRMDSLDDAVDKYRGYGVRLQFYYQSLGQLQKCFPKGQDQTLLSNTTQVYLGVNDQATAEYVSNRLGEQTIIVDSGGTNNGWSKQINDDGKSSYSRSGGGSHNWAQQVRKLLKPEEVVGLDKDVAITFTPEIPPLWTKVIKYYEQPQQTRWWEPHRVNPWKTMRTRAEMHLAAVMLLGIGLALLWCVATL